MAEVGILDCLLVATKFFHIAPAVKIRSLLFTQKFEIDELLRCHQESRAVHVTSFGNRSFNNL